MAEYAIYCWNLLSWKWCLTLFFESDDKKKEGIFFNVRNAVKNVMLTEIFKYLIVWV